MSGNDKSPLTGELMATCAQSGPATTYCTPRTGCGSRTNGTPRTAMRKTREGNDNAV
jgi:hypothetical protein